MIFRDCLVKHTFWHFGFRIVTQNITKSGVFLGLEDVRQIVLAITSGALNEIFGMDTDVERVELNLKSWQLGASGESPRRNRLATRSVLFAHVAGFATINAWGSLQQKLGSKEHIKRGRFHHAFCHCVSSTATLSVRCEWTWTAVWGSPEFLATSDHNAVLICSIVFWA